MKKIFPSLLLSYTSIVESVLENQKVQESSGRLRLLIRTCLNRKCLHVPVGYLVSYLKFSPNIIVIQKLNLII